MNRDKHNKAKCNNDLTSTSDCVHCMVTPQSVIICGWGQSNASLIFLQKQFQLRKTIS